MRRVGRGNVRGWKEYGIEKSGDLLVYDLMD